MFNDGYGCDEFGDPITMNDAISDMFPRNTECPCGSGKHREEKCDRRGIFMFYHCDDCYREKIKTYRKDCY